MLQWFLRTNSSELETKADRYIISNQTYLGTVTKNVNDMDTACDGDE